MQPPGRGVRTTKNLSVGILGAVLLLSFLLPSFATVYVEMVIEANYERTFENVVDASHTPFVHGTRFGNPDRPEIPDYEIVQDDWSAVADIGLSPPPARGRFAGSWRSG